MRFVPQDSNVALSTSSDQTSNAFIFKRDRLQVGYLVLIRTTPMHIACSLCSQIRSNGSCTCHIRRQVNQPMLVYCLCQPTSQRDRSSQSSFSIRARPAGPWGHTSEASLPGPWGRQGQTAAPVVSALVARTVARVRAATGFGAVAVGVAVKPSPGRALGVRCGLGTCAAGPGVGRTVALAWARIDAVMPVTAPQHACPPDRHLALFSREH